MKVLFVYEHKYPHLWRDGLWAALKILEKDDFDVTWVNLWTNQNFDGIDDINSYDFILGWGGFRSRVETWLRGNILIEKIKKGLCIGGNAFPPDFEDMFDVLFYETEWYLPLIQKHKNPIHAFGVNTEIYKPDPDALKIWDWTTVGAFSDWKRQQLLLDKGGYKLAIGEIQKENMEESLRIIDKLMEGGVAISDMVEPETLARIYNCSSKVYIPAETIGGGERSVLEARACGIPVEVEYDNPKLYELTKSPIWDEYYYFDQLKKGIQSVL